MLETAIVAALPELRPIGGWLRGRCPVCDSRTGLAVSDRGRWICHACDRRGWLDDGARPQVPAPIDDEDRTARPSRIWASAREPHPESGPGRYLLGRGIVPPWPSDLRSLPPSERYAAALVGAIRDAAGELTAVHLIRVDAQGRRVGSPPKISIGRCKGGAFRLDPPAVTVAICESLEDGLALRILKPGQAVWACPGASFVASVELPTIVRNVVLVLDRDDAGERAACGATRRFHAQGRRVRCVWPTLGDVCDDLAASGSGAS